MAVSRFWVGGTGNWSDTAHWSATTGGAGGQTVPVAGDTATFDVSSGSSATTTIDVAASVATFTAGSGWGGNNNSLLLNAGLTVSGVLTHTGGTLDTNGQTCTLGSFLGSGASTRTLTLGASNITVSGTGTPWDMTTTTGLTFNPNTSAITVSGSSASFVGGSLTYNNVSFTGAGTANISGGNTFNNLTRTGTAVTSTAMTLSSSQVVNGVFTCNGNSNVNTTVFRTGSTGAQRSVTVNGSFSISNTIFVGITSAGSAGTWTGTVMGDGGGNSGITFDAPRNVYWVAFSGGSANATTSWSNSDGGASGAVPPLPQDTAKWTANSITSGGRTITMNVSNMGAMDFTGVLNVPTANFATSITIYGSITFLPTTSMTLAGTSTYTARGSGSYTWNLAGQTLARDVSISPLGNSANYGTWTLSSDYRMTTADTFTLTSGTFDANGKSVTVGMFNSSNANTRTLTMGSGIWRMTGVGTIWTTGTATSLTLNIGTSTIITTDTTATAKTIAMGSLTFYDLILMGGAITWNNTTSFNNLTVYANNTTITVSAPTTKTITGAFKVISQSGDVATFVSSAPGTAYTFSKASGRVVLDYVSLTDATATGGATFYAGSHSTSVSGNTGWIFKDERQVGDRTANTARTAVARSLVGSARTVVRT